MNDIQLWTQLTSRACVKDGNLISPRYTALSNYNDTIFFRRGADVALPLQDDAVLVQSSHVSPDVLLLPLLAIVMCQTGDNEEYKPVPREQEAVLESPDDHDVNSPDDSSDSSSHEGGPPSKKRRLGAETKKDTGNLASTSTHSSRRKQAADWSTVTKTSPTVLFNHSEIHLPTHTAFLPRHPSSLLCLLRVVKLTICSRNL